MANLNAEREIYEVHVVPIVLFFHQMNVDVVLIGRFVRFRLENKKKTNR